MKLRTKLTIAAALIVAGAWGVFAQDIGGGAVNNPQVDASQLTTGTIPDARLSSNVPLLDVVNTWTPAAGAANVAVFNSTHASGPYLTLSKSGAQLGFFGDAAQLGAGFTSNAFGLTSTGARNLELGTNDTRRLFLAGDGSELQVDVTSLDFNGAADISGTLTAGGIIRSSGALSGVSFLTDQGAAANQKNFGAIYDGGQVAFYSANDGLSGLENLLVATTNTSGEWTSLTLTADAITANGSDITPETGTFSADFADACTTTPSANFTYTRYGTLVVLELDAAISCTSDSINFNTAAGELPASIRPANTLEMTGSNFTDGGSLQPGALVVLFADGTIDFDVPGAVSSWTNSGTKSVHAFVVTYHLN